MPQLVGRHQRFPFFGKFGCDLPQTVVQQLVIPRL